jgi:hypothetical protein
MAPLTSVESGPPKHLVQFYDDNDELLIANVGRYLGEGLQKGDGIAVIATAAHTQAFCDRLCADGHDVASAQQEGRAVFLGAEETLSLFMVDGQPDRQLFQRVIGAVLARLRQKTGGALRAYGEMVGLLWNAGHSSAAGKLERLWNELLSANGFQLFCAYQIDVFGNEFQAGVIDEILCAHTHLEPGGANGDLDGAVSRAMHEVLGPKAKELRLPMSADNCASWAVMPKGESAVLWIRNNMPEYADEILARARGYYRASPTRGGSSRLRN